MLQAFIITLREGVEAALIVGITLAYLAKIGRNDLRKSVYAALGSAFAGSIALAVLLSRLKWNQDIFEGWVMLVAAVFVVTMIIFMMKTGRKLKGEIEGKIGLFAREDAWIGLFLFVFLMVLREGVETVLILSAVTLNSTELMSFIGTILGVGVAILFGVMFVKGSVKINLQKFFRITTAILFLVAAQLDHWRTARTFRKRRASLFAPGDGHHRTDRPQRSILLHHDSGAGRAYGALRNEEPPAGRAAGRGRRAPQGSLVGPPRATLDGLGLRLLASSSS